MSDYSGHTVHIAVPRVLPSWNTVKGMNKFAYGRLRDGWQHDIWALVGNSRDRDWLLAMAALKKKMRVEIENERPRRIDPDNLCVKHVLDALTRLGFIAGDSKKLLEYEVTQTLGPTHETRITVREAEAKT